MPCDPQQRLRRTVCGFPTGGWSLAAERLGLRGVEIEIDHAACETLRAAGFDVIEGSVTDHKIEDHWSVSTVPGLIASPPCQTFSAAGKGAGRADMDMILLALKRWAWNPADFSDPRTALVLEPARWILGRISRNQPYEWILMEQVPTCLPIFRAYAEMLTDLEYFTAVGILHAEQYGVPQTRKRAVLIAHRQRPVSLPTPTHSKYYPRNKTKLDPGVEKWASMAEVLGWTEDAEVVSNYGTGGDPRNRGVRTGDDPAATVTEKVGRNVVRLRNGAQKNATVRDIDSPAPTILSSGDNGDTRWVLRSDNRPNSAERSLEEPAPTILGNGAKGTHASWRFAGAGQTAEVTAGQIPREVEEPAHTITGKGTAAWVHDRPSTTVNCDPRISKPGRHDPNESGSQQRGSIRVTVQEAGILQSFPADHPWQGTKTQQYQQAGNAIPVLLAGAIIGQIL